MWNFSCKATLGISHPNMIFKPYKIRMYFFVCWFIILGQVRLRYNGYLLVSQGKGTTRARYRIIISPSLIFNISKVRRGRWLNASMVPAFIDRIEEMSLPKTTHNNAKLLCNSLCLSVCSSVTRLWEKYDLLSCY